MAPALATRNGLPILLKLLALRLLHASLLWSAITWVRLPSISLATSQITLLLRQLCLLLPASGPERPRSSQRITRCAQCCWVSLPVGLLSGQNKGIWTYFGLCVCQSMCVYTYMYIYLVKSMVSITIPDPNPTLHGVHSISFLFAIFELRASQELGKSSTT